VWSHTEPGILGEEELTTTEEVKKRDFPLKEFRQCGERGTSRQEFPVLKKKKKYAP